MHDRGTIDDVMGLVEQGLDSFTINARTGVPSSTIRMWRAGRRPKARVPFVTSLASLPGPAYAYLLGMYLGDGDLTTTRRGVHRLRVALDSGYPLVYHECAAAMSLVMPTSRVLIQRERANLVRVGSFSKQWIRLLPQHGPGRKHLRPIVLQAWQRTITHRHPQAFLRGLFHSDGSRHLNTVQAPRTGKRYAYVRYEFSNRSPDIKGLLCEHLDLLGID